MKLLMISLWHLVSISACPEKWTQSGRHCYYYNSTPTDWSRAKDSCMAMSGTLACIESDDDEATDLVYFKQNQDLDMPMPAWLGLLFEYGAWGWVNGASLEWSVVQEMPPPQPLDMDGGWGEWDSWEECTCNSVQTRERLCDNPLPVGDGNQCQGSLMESRTCATCEGDRETTWQKLGTNKIDYKASLLSEQHVVSRTSCAKECTEVASCKSFSYDTTGRTCRLIGELPYITEAEDWEVWTSETDPVLPPVM